MVLKQDGPSVVFFNSQYFCQNKCHEFFFDPKCGVILFDIIVLHSLEFTKQCSDLK